MKQMDLFGSKQNSDEIIITDNMFTGTVYDGMTMPQGFILDGKRYIMKEEELKSQVYSEYVGSTFISNLGLDAQVVHFGKYNGKLVTVLEDFKKPGEVFHAFRHTEQSAENNKIAGSRYTLCDLIEIVRSCFSDDYRRLMAHKFYNDMFTCDAILGNSDRHSGNWGFLESSHGFRIAPIYDNASSLCPKVDKSIEHFEEDRYEFLKPRVTALPYSMLALEIDGKLVYDYRRIFEHLGGTALSRNLCDGDVFDAIRRAVVKVPDKVFRDFYVMLVMTRFFYIIRGENYDNAYRYASKFACF